MSASLEPGQWCSASCWLGAHPHHEHLLEGNFGLKKGERKNNKSPDINILAKIKRENTGFAKPKKILYEFLCFIVLEKMIASKQILSLKLLMLCLIMIKWLWCVLVKLAGIHGPFLCFVVAAFLSYSFQMLSVLSVIYWALLALVLTSILSVLQDGCSATIK